MPSIFQGTVNQIENNSNKVSSLERVQELLAASSLNADDVLSQLYPSIKYIQDLPTDSEQYVEVNNLVASPDLKSGLYLLNMSTGDNIGISTNNESENTFIGQGSGFFRVIHSFGASSLSGVILIVPFSNWKMSSSAATCSDVIYYKWSISDAQTSAYSASYYTFAQSPDQTYDEHSANAQSGKAVAEAVSTKADANNVYTKTQTVDLVTAKTGNVNPTVLTVADFIGQHYINTANGKVFECININHETNEYFWLPISNPTVDQVYNSTSTNAQSGKAVAQAINELNSNKASTSAMQAADNNLQSQIDAITSASDVVDVVGTYADLQAYDTTSLPDKSIIKVLQDETRDDAITYYRWVINSTTHVGAWSYIGSSGPYYTQSEANALLDDKVDKVEGKGLSTNDFTDALKTKLDGIEAGAEVNVNADWDATSGDAEILNKPTTLTGYGITSEDQLLKQKADIDGTYPLMSVGNSQTTEDINSNLKIEDTRPYTFRVAGGEGNEIGNIEEDTLVGGTVAWNQLIDPVAATTVRLLSVTSENGKYTISGQTAENEPGGGRGEWITPATSPINIIEGHKYFKYCTLDEDNLQFIITKPTDTSKLISFPKGTYKFIVANNESGTYRLGFNVVAGQHTYNTTGYLQLFDLTQMFGSTLADYIYSLENANAGAGYAYFKNIFPLDYYPYNAGELLSVKTSAHKMIGFNAYNKATDSAKVLRGFDYQITGTYNSAQIPVEFNLDTTTGYFKPTYTTTLTSLSGIGGSSNTCVHLRWDDERDGEYEDYIEHNYPLDSNLELRGLVGKNDNGDLVYDGDIYNSDGTVIRKYKKIELSTLSWNISGSGNFKFFYASVADVKSSTIKAICNKYLVVEGPMGPSTGTNKTLVFTGTQLRLRDLDYDTVSDLITSLNGVMLVYELATPTTESADPFTNPQVVDNWGTEEYVPVEGEVVQLPVGHNTKYSIDLKAKLEVAPDSPAESGEYILTHDSSNGKNEYKKIDGWDKEYYPEMSTGLSNNLMSNIKETDTVPYTYRTSGGNTNIGNREIDEIFGGTVVWNQLIENGDFETTSHWSGYNVTISASNNVLSCTYTNDQPPYTDAYRLSYLFLALTGGHKHLASYYMKTPHNQSTRLVVYQSGSSVITATVPTKANEWTHIVFVFTPSYTVDRGDLRVACYPTEDTQIGDVVQFKNFQIFDITQMFGSAVTSRIENLENNPTVDDPHPGFTFFNRLFPKSYYEYNTGTLMSVKTSAHKMVGFNLLKDDVLSQTINSSYTKIDGDNKTSFLNFLKKIQLLNKPFYYSIKVSNSATTSGAQVGEIRLTDESSGSVVNLKSIVPNNEFLLSDIDLNRVTHVYLYGRSPAAEVTFSDPCFSIHWDEERDGDYEPYREVTYPLSDVELNGVPLIDSNNNLYYDGDVYSDEGKITRNYAKTVLKDIPNKGPYGNTGHMFRFTFSDGATSNLKILINGYTQTSGAEYSYNAPNDKTFYALGNSIYLRDDSIQMYVDLSSYGSAPTFSYSSGSNTNFYKKLSVNNYADIATLKTMIGTQLLTTSGFYIIEVLSDEEQSNRKTYYAYSPSYNTLTLETSVMTPSYADLLVEPSDWATNWSDYYQRNQSFDWTQFNSDLIYSLKTPTVETENILSYTNPQWVDDWGTEEYVDSRDIQIPVGHNTEYDVNLKAKLETLPDAPDTNGEYIIDQSDVNGTTYKSLADSAAFTELRDYITVRVPAPPTTDGTYKLNCTVTNGNPTYSWGG